MGAPHSPPHMCVHTTGLCLLTTEGKEGEEEGEKRGREERERRQEGRRREGEKRRREERERREGEKRGREKRGKKRERLTMKILVYNNSRDTHTLRASVLLPSSRQQMSRVA